MLPILYLFFKNYFSYHYDYPWLCWVFLAVCRPPLVAELRVGRFSLWQSLVLQSTGGQCLGFCSCACSLSGGGAWAYLLQGLWNLLGAETEPMLPVLEAWSLNHVPTGKVWVLGTYYFSSLWRTSFNVSCKAGFLVSIFVFLRTSLFLTSVLKNNFMEFSILVWWPFSPPFQYYV